MTDFFTAFAPIGAIGLIVIICLLLWLNARRP